MGSALVLLAATLAAPNPVLRHTADCGVFRFNGEYCLMGTDTAGHAYSSPDLVHWSTPFHVFSMDNDWATGAAGYDAEIHACDLVQHNGRVHLYWSVNHGELRQIGHAVANTPRDRFREPVRERPLDGRIDPHVLVDDDGQIYFYTVKFTDGNVIWGQPMADPWTLIGDAVPMLSALRHTWETLDHRVNEGPTVRRYRGRYYMLYNANHTWQRYGHYALGCAVADAPLGFSNDGKYLYPVVNDTRDRVLGAAAALVPVSTEEAVSWRYTETAPPQAWNGEFDDSGWTEASAGFGNPDLFMMRGTLRTPWKSGGIWLRRSFSLDALPAKAMTVYINHDGHVEVFLNGVSVGQRKDYVTGYAALAVPPEAHAALRVGENVLAVYCAHDGQGAQYVDAGLYAHPGTPSEPIVANCGQPNLLRGPNGFEWWLDYFAIYDGGPGRDQGIDRVHFLGQELFVEGPTVADTPGYHPGPTPPTFEDRFDAPDALASNWKVEGGWSVDSEVGVQGAERGLTVAIPDAPAGRYYRFETGVRFRCNSGRAGIVAGDDGSGDRIYLLLDRSAGAWSWSKDGAVSEVGPFPLPADYHWGGWHTLAIEKNGRRLTAFLDGIPAPGQPVLDLAEGLEGRPGLATEDATAEFDGVTYTLGWDEWGAAVQDWEGTSGLWKVDKEGLLATPAGEEAMALKGDPLDAYEFSVQVIPGAGVSECGVYATFRDDRDFLRIAVTPDFRTVTVTEKRNGEVIPPQIATVKQRQPRMNGPDDGVNIRVVQRSRDLIVWIDGVETLSVPDAWGGGRAGLFTAGGPCRFNGLTCFDRSAADD